MATSFWSLSVKAQEAGNERRCTQWAERGHARQSQLAGPRLRPRHLRRNLAERLYFQHKDCVLLARERQSISDSGAQKGLCERR